MTRKIGIGVLVIVLLIAAFVLFGPKKDETAENGGQGLTDGDIQPDTAALSTICPQVAAQHKGYAEDEGWWQELASVIRGKMGISDEMMRANDNRIVAQVQAFAKGHDIEMKNVSLQFYTEDIRRYINAGGAHQHWDLEVGEYICADPLNVMLP